MFANHLLELCNCFRILHTWHRAFSGQKSSTSSWMVSSCWTILLSQGSWSVVCLILDIFYQIPRASFKHLHFHRKGVIETWRQATCCSTQISQPPVVL